MMRRFVCRKNYVHLQNYGYKVTRWNLRWNLYDSVHCVAVLRWLLICKKAQTKTGRMGHGGTDWSGTETKCPCSDRCLLDHRSICWESLWRPRFKTFPALACGRSANQPTRWWSRQGENPIHSNTLASNYPPCMCVVHCWTLEGFKPTTQLEQSSTGCILPV